ncbi:MULTISPECIES: DJ-1 family glyoxalase III [unclassified Streptococcus]|uniref:DJ-1 family glyoxalase III n=1 Tax=unclassified Streptococcus TaxID=2608887 RepID=UPI001071FA25|nr:MULTISPECIES: DJ-1 family glyoxalase III [unclassified Streptococcus]MBF0786531.1 DJ-1/PfpI family protein [Streptococcus sp. 19428wC2_LYSM12]MCQ9212313.1 DJ-1/PfpI family protein [Streptococcus sp. B01]MCQ9213644.1 DJ-1/PfpI family protein [Streptococcus sp. O1]TFV06693.1 DJ-1/PfpI family protein [Streptococcus sp. LYSM12]
MKKVAVVLANGFEEIEALTPVDVLRRASITCDMVGLTGLEVEGSHGIKVQADKLFTGDLSAYDMIVLPGGMPGSVHLQNHTGLIAALQAAAKKDTYIAAICAAPIVLEKAGLLADRRYTCYPGQEKTIASGHHVSETVVVDATIVTSRGAGTALAFAYTLVDLIGGDGSSLARSMVYEQ